MVMTHPISDTSTGNRCSPQAGYSLPTDTMPLYWLVYCHTIKSQSSSSLELRSFMLVCVLAWPSFIGGQTEGG
jgi:hypothetical protein